MTALLAVDTACGSCSVAIAKDHTVLAEHLEEAREKQAERLIPLIEQACDDARLHYQQIDALAVTIGPGSFTGVRIGLSAMKGLALSLALPLIGISTLEAHASIIKAPPSSMIMVLLNAGRNQAYMAQFDAGLTPLSEPALISLSDIPDLLKEETHIAGNCHHLLEHIETKDSILHENHLLNAADIIPLALQKYPHHDEQTSPRPLYIRPPDAKLPT